LAAAHDQRFSPVSHSELANITIEISILTQPEPIVSPDQIKAGQDGVLLILGSHQGVFLPSVWQETGWTRSEFLSQLATQKAGLQPDAWKQAQLFTFQAQTFH